MTGLFPRAIWSVSEATSYMRSLLEGDEILTDIWVKGEISNYSASTSGHIYFTLKDVNASLRCVIWRSQAARLQATLRDGMAIEAHGAVTIYEKGGQYQLIVDGLRKAGEGALYEEFIKLKEKLQQEGLFEETRKRPLPAYPQNIVVITSPAAAALQDILNTLRGRYPLAVVAIAPCAVQGIEAPIQIVRAFNTALTVKPDVILLARGGGSLEDLWAFNDEKVVRAIAACPVPVVTGIGHETDFTLSDFAADVRAPTPTGAAVSVTPDIADMRAQLEGNQLQLAVAARSALRVFSDKLLEQKNRLQQYAPGWRVQQGLQRVDELQSALSRLAHHHTALRYEHLRGMRARLDALNPREVINRGFAILTDVNGKNIVSVSAIQFDQAIRVRVRDGNLGARVTDIKRDVQE